MHHLLLTVPAYEEFHPLQNHWLDLHFHLLQVKLLVWFLCVLTYLELSWTEISLSYCQQKTTLPSVSSTEN